MPPTFPICLAARTFSTDEGRQRGSAPEAGSPFESNHRWQHFSSTSAIADMPAGGAHIVKAEVADDRLCEPAATGDGRSDPIASVRCLTQRARRRTKRTLMIFRGVLSSTRPAARLDLPAEPPHGRALSALPPGGQQARFAASAHLTASSTPKCRANASPSDSRQPRTIGASLSSMSIGYRA